MKYVIFTNIKTGLSLPVFCANFLTHADLSAGPGFLATSAGFFDTKTCRAFGESDSLELKSRKGDADICLCILGKQESQIFLVQDTEENLDRVEERTAQLKEMLHDAEIKNKEASTIEEEVEALAQIKRLESWLGQEVAK